MKIHLVNYEVNFGIDAILSKYARMMERELIDLGHEVSVSGKPEKADVNHHINFISYQKSGGKDTTMITHLSGDKFMSEQTKIDMVKEQLKTSIGICMNDEIKEKLVKAGCDKKKLFVSGHAHDSIPRRPIIIALVFNAYPDGRKREEMIVSLFEFLKKNKKQHDFVFRVMGKGWKPLLDKLIKKGMKQVQYTDLFTSDLYQQFLYTSDFLLYTGDEDSLAQSVIDAKQANLRVIAPPRKEFTIEYPFETQGELNSIFLSLTGNEVEDWNWTNFVKSHLKVWEKM